MHYLTTTMDLTNLRESLDTADADGGRRVCDERLSKEFKGEFDLTSRGAAAHKYVQGRPEK